MSDEPFEDEPDLDGEVEEDELEDDLVLEDDDAVVLVEDVLEGEIIEAEVIDTAIVAVAEPAPAPAKAGEDEDDDVVDLDEELHPDDVEDPLDVLLKEKTASERLDVDEEELEEADDDEPGERGSTRIAPRRADEFLCSSCFLVLPLSQLADEKRQLCRDCV